jgi:hypothetical protein
MKPAFPTLRPETNGTYASVTPGLTAREYIATHLLAGMLANPSFTPMQDYMLMDKVRNLTDRIMEMDK